MKLNLEYGDYVLIHPGNLKWLQSQLESERKIEQDYIFQIRSGLDIRTSEIMDQYKQIGWQLSNKCPESKFWNLIDDITNPPSYAITWGWVEPELVPDFKIVRSPRFRFYDMNMPLIETRKMFIKNSTC